MKERILLKPTLRDLMATCQLDVKLSVAIAKFLNRNV